MIYEKYENGIQLTDQQKQTSRESEPEKTKICRTVCASLADNSPQKRARNLAIFNSRLTPPNLF